jgi:hypothetical protein
MPVSFDSFKEWMQDGGRTLDRSPTAPEANRRYAASQDRRLYFFSSPYARSGRITMTGGLFPGDTGDFITMGWPGSWTTVTGGTYPNGALPAFIDVAQSGNRSMMNPGISFRFVSGPSPTTIGVESEARGVVMTTLRANFSSTIGDTSPPLFQPFDRGMILLNPGGTVVNLRLPVRTTSEGVTIEAWLENPTSPNAGKFSVWLRCGALPNATDYHQRRYFGTNVPVFIRSTDNCTSERFVSIASEPGAPAAVIHLTAHAHRESQIINNLRVGIPGFPSATEFVGITYGFKSAAWRLYGATEGTRIITSYVFYRNDLCHTEPQFGCDGPQGGSCDVCLSSSCSRSYAQNGKVYLCGEDVTRLKSGGAAEIDAWYGPARVLAHEFGHALLGLPDEYAEPVSGCAHQTMLCAHSIMDMQYNNTNSLCNSLNHRSLPEYTATSYQNIDRIRGPNGITCGPQNIAADPTSAWQRWSPSTPFNGLIPLVQQNMAYVPQGFTLRQDIGRAYEN